MVSTPDKQLATMLSNIENKTGKPLEAWQALLSKTDMDRHGQMVKFLKSEHGVTHGFANLIASQTLSALKDDAAPVDWVEVQYQGAKAALRPIYEALLHYGQSLGRDVEVAPKKASVSVRRKKQFMLIIPATKTRIDLGLALKGDPETERLERYNAMCSHRVRLQSVEAIDAELKAWIKTAYERAG